MNAVAEVIVAIAFFLLIGSICADILIGTVAHIREMAAIKERSRDWEVLFAAARNAKREYERKSAALEPTGWDWRGPDDSPPAGSQCVVVLDGGRPVGTVPPSRAAAARGRSRACSLRQSRSGLLLRSCRLLLNVCENSPRFVARPRVPAPLLAAAVFAAEPKQPQAIRNKSDLVPEP